MGILVLLIAAAAAGAALTGALLPLIERYAPAEARVRHRAWIPALLAGLLWAAAVYRFPEDPYLFACLPVTVLVVWAAWVDWRCHALPLQLTLGAGAVAAAGVVLADAASGSTGSWIRAIALGAALGGALTLVGVLAPQLFAFGDVLLAIPLAILIGYWGWEQALMLPFAAALAALPGTLIAAVRARSLAVYLPFGPALVAGAVLMIAAASAVAQ